MNNKNQINDVSNWSNMYEKTKCNRFQEAKIEHYQEKKALKAESKKVAAAQASVMDSEGGNLISARSGAVGGNIGSSNNDKEPRKEKWTPCDDNG